MSVPLGLGEFKIFGFEYVSTLNMEEPKILSKFSYHGKAFSYITHHVSLFTRYFFREVLEMSRFLLISLAVFVFIGIIFTNNTLSVDKKDLVAYWSFNKGSGGTVTDDSGNGFNGKVIDSKWAKDGKMGGAMDFDGVGAYVEVPSDPGLDPGTDNWTVELWLKRFDNAGDWHKILTKYPCCNYNGYRLGLLNGNIHVIFGIAAPPNCVEITTTKKIEDQDWHHIAFTADRNGDVIVYIDGEPDAQKSIKQIKGESILTPQNLEIGRCHWCGGGKTSGFNGSIDEVKIWRAALTKDEISQAMNGKLAIGVSPKGELPTYWGQLKKEM